MSKCNNLPNFLLISGVFYTKGNLSENSLFNGSGSLNHHRSSFGRHFEDWNVEWSFNAITIYQYHPKYLWTCQKRFELEFQIFWIVLWFIIRGGIHEANYNVTGKNARWSQDYLVRILFQHHHGIGLKNGQWNAGQIHAKDKVKIR